MPAVLSLAVSNPAPAAPALSTRHLAVAAGIDSALYGIEDGFLAVGNVLAEAVNSVGGLIASVDRLASALNPEMVAATEDSLARAAASLDELPSDLEHRGRQLASLAGHAAGLGVSVEDMELSLSYLRIFAVYVKLAAGGIRAQGLEFTSFAEEISECIETGRRRLSLIGGEISSLEADLARALKLGDRVSATCVSGLPATCDSIIANAAALRVQQTGIADAARTVSSLAQGVRSKVGRVLGALQIGDISRQRLEHLQAGLIILDAHADRLDTEPASRLLAFGHCLLGALLAAARHDFRAEADEIARSMGELADDAAQILLLLEEAHGAGRSGKGDFLTCLDDQVAAALTLVDAVRAADREAVATGLSGAQAALRLAEQVDDIQVLRRDVEQMALNTRLKSSQIGEEGRPMGVIALELRAQGAVLDAAAARALATIGDLGGSAQQVVTLAAAEDTARSAQAARALAEAATLVRRAGGMAGSDLTALASHGVSVINTLRRAAGGLEIRDAIGKALASVAGGIPIPDSHAVLDLNGVAEEASSFLDLMGRQYTMKQERDVHANIAERFGLHAVAGRGGAEPQNVPIEVDGLF